MATVPEIEYPTSDGRPMAESDVHRNDMVGLIEALKVHFKGDPQVYVSGNLLMYYVPGDKHRHVSPDVFVVRGIEKRQRDNYLVWEEGKGPDLTIELTSPSTREEDLETKFTLYRDTLQVREYFLFDPRSEYLDPPLQGYRLSRGRYVPIRPVEGRLPSKVIDLHLERDGSQLRLYDPIRKRWLATPQENAEGRQKAETAERKANAARRRAEAAQQRESLAREQAESEVERLRRENEELRRRLAGEKK